MLLVGLTGGIASGKSTVSALLAERGAEIVDADQIARDVVRPGEPAWHKIRDHFGPDVLNPDGTIDRRALGEVVFADRAKLALLNEVTHPAILARIADRLEKVGGSDAIVVLDAALLVETGLDAGADLVVVVDAPREAQLERLEARGMDAAHALARVAAQAGADERLARADVVIHNGGTMDELVAKVDGLWADLEARLASSRGGGNGQPPGR
jgi:dephospho-CoA kinase